MTSLLVVQLNIVCKRAKKPKSNAIDIKKAAVQLPFSVNEFML